jgi:hypothetical protein
MNLYGPALYRSDLAYLPKPLSSDSSHHANYVSAAIYSGSGAGPSNDDDVLTRGELNIGQGFTFSHFNVGYGVFGTLGDYSNYTDPSGSSSFSSKFFGAAGGRFSADAFVTLGRVDIRFIGFEIAYSHEFGDYAVYRKEVDVPYTYTNKRTDLTTLGGTSEVIWHSSDPNIQFGLRLFMGNTLGDYAYHYQNMTFTYYNNGVSGSLAYFMQIHRYFFVGELNNNGGQLRFGLRF